MSLLHRYGRRVHDDDHPWAMSFERDEQRPTVDRDGLPVPPPRAFFCRGCNPVCESCPLNPREALQ